MDWYNEAKLRQQDLIDAANSRRLVKSAESGGRSRARTGEFMVWLGGRLVASGKRLQGPGK